MTTGHIRRALRGGVTYTRSLGPYNRSMSHLLMLSPLPHEQEVEPLRCLGSYNRRVAELRSKDGLPYAMHFFFTHVTDFHLVPGAGALVVTPGPVESCWESLPSCLGSDFLRSVERLLAGEVVLCCCCKARGILVAWRWEVSPEPH